MPLFHIQDDDRPLYVVAHDYNQAVAKWQKIVKDENDDIEEPILPKAVALIADDHDLVIGERPVRP